METNTGVYRYKTIQSILWKAILVFSAIIILVSYIFIASTNGVPLVVDVGSEYHELVRTPCLVPDLAPHHYGFYNLLADSFTVGRTDLLINPPQELLKLPNPRDGQANENTRILDISLFGDRYYLYFGPVPALAMFIPFRWLGIGKLSEPLAVAMFCYGMFLCSLYILLTCVQKYIPKASKVLVISAVFALGFSNSVPWILRHPVVYEVAISSGAFFAMLGLAFLFQAYQSNKGKHKWFLLFSLTLGLAAGCRPIYFFSCIFILAVWGFCSARQSKQWKEKLIDAVYLAAPFSLCILALVAYNYLRFGSPSEFGMTYMLGPGATALDFKPYMYRFCNVPPHLFQTALSLPKLDAVFPFVHPIAYYPLQIPIGYNIEEPCTGFLVTTPIIPALMILSILAIRKTKLTNIASLITFGLLILIIEAFMIPATTMRYQVDFLPTILLGVLIFCVSFEAELTKGKRRWLRAGMLLLIWAGILTHLALGMTGLKDTFRRGNPQSYFALADFFQPISIALSKLSRQEKEAILPTTLAAGISGLHETDGPWLGEKGVYLWYYTSKASEIKIRFKVIVPPENLEGINLCIRYPEGETNSLVLTGTTLKEFDIQLMEGANRIELFASPTSTSANTSDLVHLAVLTDLELIYPTVRWLMHTEKHPKPPSWSTMPAETKK